MFNWLSSFRDLLIAHPAQTNLVVILLVLIPGALAWLFPPESLKKHPKLRHVLEFWLAQWFVVFFVYLFFISRRQPLISDATAHLDWKALAFLDVQTVLIFAFCYAMMEGDNLRVHQVWVGTAVMAGVAVVYSVIISLFPVPAPRSPWRWGWILPSAFASSISFGLFGGVFLTRYGWIALPIFIVSCGYAILEWPIYVSTAVMQSPDRRWYVALALMRLLLGSLFYVYLCAPLKAYPSLSMLRSDPEASKYLRSQLKGWIGILEAVLIAVVGTVVASFFTGR